MNPTHPCDGCKHGSRPPEAGGSAVCWLHWIVVSDAAILCRDRIADLDRGPIVYRPRDVPRSIAFPPVEFGVRVLPTVGSRDGGDHG